MRNCTAQFDGINMISIRAFRDKNNKREKYSTISAVQRGGGGNGQSEARTRIHHPLGEIGVKPSLKKNPCTPLNIHLSISTVLDN